MVTTAGDIATIASRYRAPPAYHAIDRQTFPDNHVSLLRPFPLLERPDQKRSEHNDVDDHAYGKKPSESVPALVTLARGQLGIPRTPSLAFLRPWSRLRQYQSGITRA
jgi:hypothetical protein